jgi:peptidyl-prolyl cis-trans isomerase B (cyclophilin B)
MNPGAPRALLALVAASALALSACSAGGAGASKTIPPLSSPTTGTASTPAPATAAPTSAGAASGCPTKAPGPLGANETRTVTIATAKGSIVIKVENQLGPLAAGNFVALAECGYYKDVIFHRLVPGFVIQGGDGQFGREPSVDPARAGQGGPGYAFADDPVYVPYARGTVAMANSGPNTNGSQFFIVLADAGLPPSYSVFGHVTAGMDVVDAIASMPSSGPPNDAALDPVPMTSVTVAKP